MKKVFSYLCLLHKYNSLKIEYLAFREQVKSDLFKRTLELAQLQEQIEQKNDDIHKLIQKNKRLKESKNVKVKNCRTRCS